MNDLAAVLDSLQDAAGLIDFAASWLDNPLAEKPQTLETFDLESGVKKVSEKLTRQIGILEMTREISAEAKDVMDRAQRENLLREKIASAKKAKAS